MSATRRRGFTLPEVIIALVVLGILGLSITKLITSQTRYFAHEINLRKSRSVARNSMGILVSDLRMVQDIGGIDSAATDGSAIRVLVPYRFGLVCGTNGNTTTVSMLPADSAAVALGVYAGFAWRGTTGSYNYVTTATAPAASSSPTTCTGSGAGEAQLRQVSVAGRTGEFLDLTSPAPSGATPVTPVFFWQHITYVFKASAAYPGRNGLWRIVQGGPSDEIMAPFDPSARFRFYVSGEDSSRAALPALANIRGVQVVLNALSPRTTSNSTTPAESKLTTSIFFKNVHAF